MRLSVCGSFLRFRRGSLATFFDLLGLLLHAVSLLGSLRGLCPGLLRDKAGVRLFAPLSEDAISSEVGGLPFSTDGRVRLISSVYGIYDRGRLRSDAPAGSAEKSSASACMSGFGIRELQPAFRAYQCGIVHRGIASGTTHNITPYSLHFHILYQNGQIKKSFWAIVADNCHRHGKIIHWRIGMEIYFDNSATTQPFECARQAVLACMTEAYYNPSALYAPAVKVSKILSEETRAAFAREMRVKEEEDHLHLRRDGIQRRRDLGRGAAAYGAKAHVITDLTEHSSVYETFRLFRAIARCSR